MTDKMKNLWVRAVSGVVLLAIVLGTILWSKWSFGALLLMIILGGEWEFYRMAEKAGYSPQKTLGLVAGAIVMTVAFALMWFFDTESTLSNKYLVLTVGLMLYIMMLVPLMFICELYRKSATPIANIGSTLTGVVYVALLFYFFIIWANDVCAYLFGITLGKHRLFERISPKKSWEGFIGGLIGAMAMGYIAATAMGGDHFEWIGMALIAAITGVFGDLVESLFKRSVDVKDSGRIIPGHGGWLDRFDALILSVPFVFIYLVFCMN